MHHIELYVSDLKVTQAFYTNLLVNYLGFTISRQWDSGICYSKEAFYLVFVETKKRDYSFNRTNIGLNHLAFKIDTIQALDRLRMDYLKEGKTTLLYDEYYPFAGGKNHYALYLEDPDRLKLEIVASQS